MSDIASKWAVEHRLGQNPPEVLALRSATDHFEDLPVELVLRSVGYHGVPLPGVPFNEKWGVILNKHGRVLDVHSRRPQVGEYTAGWIKRGPNGVLGTNKGDALETVECMMRILRLA